MPGAIIDATSSKTLTALGTYNPGPSRLKWMVSCWLFADLAFRSGYRSSCSLSATLFSKAKMARSASTLHHAWQVCRDTLTEAAMMSLRN